eukprot:gene43067-53449_t
MESLRIYLNSLPPDAQDAYAKLARSNAQLPVNVYFDETLLQREMQQLFKAGPRYVGHELMVPNTGDFATLVSENEGRMLVRNANGLEVLSNVCRHRQALMFNGRGNSNTIVCPLHRWTYDLKGELIDAVRDLSTPGAVRQHMPSVDLYHSTDYRTVRMDCMVVATLHDALPLSHPEWWMQTCRGTLTASPM